MRYQFFFILVTSLLFKLILSNQRKCDIVEIGSNEKFISKQSNVLLIENDKDELQDFNYDNINIVEESIKISNFEDEYLISTQIIEPFSLEKWLCKLIKSQIYVISCIKIPNFSAREIFNFNDQSILKFELSNLNGSQCEEFFFNQQSQFLIFCQNNYYLNIYSIDLERIIKLEIQYKIDQRQYEMCKNKYYEMEDNHYLILFFKCEIWGVYSYINQDLKILLNQQLALSDYTIQISYLENIQLCQKTLYLIIEKGFYQFEINNLNQATFNLFILSFQNLKQILLSWSCSFLFYVESDSSNNKTIILNNGNQFQQTFDGQSMYIHQIKNILFVKLQNELLIIYNLKIKQSIKMNSSYIFFNDKYNLVYQFDRINNQIVFYEFSYPRNLLKPTQKFIFYIYTSHFPFQNIQYCSEIKYITQTNSTLNKTLKYQNTCQKTSLLFLSKQGLNLPNQYSIKLQQNYKFGISMFDQYSFIQICPQLKNTNQQDQILIYFEIKKNNQSLSVIRTKNYIYLQNCDNIPQFKIQIQEYIVFHFQSQIMLWYLDKNLLKLIKLEDETILQIKFDTRITNIVQFQEVVLVFTSNNEAPELLDILTQKRVILKSEVYKILNKINEFYFKNKENSENKMIQSFYFSKLLPQFIQYLQYFIVQFQANIIYFSLENIQIVFIKQMMSKQFYILGIHLINNQIIDHYFDFEQIQILYNLNLDDYKFIRPLKYQISTHHLAIACEKQNIIFALIFELRIPKPLKLLKIIQISKIEFFLSQDNFFYYDSFGEIIIVKLLNFQIQLENLVPYQRDYITNTKIKFQIISANKTEPALNLQFQLKCYNECQEIFQLRDNFLLNYSSNNLQKILISNYFFGPIDLVKIADNDKTQINGPLLLSDEILPKYNLEGITLKIIYLPPNFHNPYTQSKNLIFYNSSQQSIIFNQKNEIFFNAILLDEERILFLFFSDKNCELIGKIYQIEKDSLNIINQLMFEITITLKQANDQYRVFKTGNLIVFKSETIVIIYMIIKSGIKLIENNLNIQDIIKIQGENDLYISLSKGNFDGDYLFSIIYFKEFDLIFNGTAILFWDEILSQLKNYIDIDNYKSANHLNKRDILECNIQQQIVRILIFQSLRQYSVLSEILLNLNNQSIKYIPQKIIRNAIEGEMVTLELYNKNNLLLKSISNSIYFYDLNQDFQIFDYIGRQDYNNYSYYSLNTTHFFILQSNSDTDQIFIGEVGYKIDEKNQTLFDKTFTLVAENKVSQAQCNITMIYIDDQNEDYFVFKKIISILMMIIVFYFLIRRMQLKRKQLNNLKQSKIDQSDSNEESQNNE